MFAYNKGKLVKWHDDRGYGFIDPENNAKQVFLHISVLRRRAERRPQEGDVIWYQLDMDRQDRIQASNAYIEGISYGSMDNRSASKNREKPSRPAAVSTTQRREPRDEMRQMSQKRSQVSAMDHFQKQRDYHKISLYVMIFIVVVVGFLIVKGIISLSPKEIPQNQSSLSSSSEPSQTFQCAGKTRCSEMSSCEEAVFYQNHCPNTQMDGDGDGKPCEDRCGH